MVLDAAKKSLSGNIRSANVLSLDSKSKCFVCLEKCDLINIEDVNLRSICRFLKIRPPAVLSKSLRDFGLGLEDDLFGGRACFKNNNASLDFSVMLCPECYCKTDKLNRLIKELELIQMRLCDQVDVFCKSLTNAKQESMLANEANVSLGSAVDKKLVKNLRRETIRKCREQLNILSSKCLPKVMLTKITIRTVGAEVSEIQNSETMSSHVPVEAEASENQDPEILSTSRLPVGVSENPVSESFPNDFPNHVPIPGAVPENHVTLVTDHDDDTKLFRNPTENSKLNKVQQEYSMQSEKCSSNNFNSTAAFTPSLTQTIKKEINTSASTSQLIHIKNPNNSNQSSEMPSLIVTKTSHLEPTHVQPWKCPINGCGRSFFLSKSIQMHKRVCYANRTRPIFQEIETPSVSVSHSVNVINTCKNTSNCFIEQPALPPDIPEVTANPQPIVDEHSTLGPSAFVGGTCQSWNRFSSNPYIYSYNAPYPSTNLYTAEQNVRISNHESHIPSHFNSPSNMPYWNNSTGNTWDYQQSHYPSSFMQPATSQYPAQRNSHPATATGFNNQTFTVPSDASYNLTQDNVSSPPQHRKKTSKTKKMANTTDFSPKNNKIKKSPTRKNHNLPCKRCGKVYPSSYKLRIHYFSRHVDELFTMCKLSDTTQEYFETACQLLMSKELDACKTIKRAGTEIEEKFCSHCGKGFRMTCDLKDHLYRVHFGSLAERLKLFQEQDVMQHTPSQENVKSQVSPTEERNIETSMSSESGHDISGFSSSNVVANETPTDPTSNSSANYLQFNPGNNFCHYNYSDNSSVHVYY